MANFNKIPSARHPDPIPGYMRPTISSLNKMREKAENVSSRILPETAHQKGGTTQAPLTGRVTRNLTGLRVVAMSQLLKPTESLMDRTENGPESPLTSRSTASTESWGSLSSSLTSTFEEERRDEIQDAQHIELPPEKYAQLISLEKEPDLVEEEFLGDGTAIVRSPFSSNERYVKIISFDEISPPEEIVFPE